jgi:hypothetical protein
VPPLPSLSPNIHVQDSPYFCEQWNLQDGNDIDTAPPPVLSPIPNEFHINNNTIATNTSQSSSEHVGVTGVHPTSGQATPASPLPSRSPDIRLLDTAPPPALLPIHNGSHINNNTIATNTSPYSASALSAQCHVLRFPVNTDQDNLSPLTDTAPPPSLLPIHNGSHTNNNTIASNTNPYSASALSAQYHVLRFPVNTDQDNLSPLTVASARIPDVQVDSNDPLCHLIDIEEFKGFSLMTKFQPDLKVFVCERCQCGVWADHLTGHIFGNHKAHLPRTLKRAAVEQAVQKVKGRLHPGESSAIALLLPGRSLPPMPWLRPPILGHQCRLCPYVAGTVDSVRAHGKKSHPRETCTSEHDPQVLAQRMFVRTQYFRVHAVLQDVGPGDVFSKFYAALPTHYVDGSFVNGNLVGAPDYSDLSPFLTAAGWVQATEGYSMAMIRSMSGCKVHPEEPHADSWGRVKGLGKKYFSSLRSTSNIDGNLLDALTSWRVRR